MDAKTPLRLLFIGNLLRICNPTTVINIGAIFQEGNPETEVAFRFAISRVNMYSGEYQLQPLIRRISGKDSFATGQTVCELVGKGVAAIFGPDTASTNEIIESVAKNLEIPQFQVFWNPKVEQFSAENEYKDNLIFNLFPDPHMLATAFATLLNEMKWKKYAVLYETDEGLIRLQEILKQHGPQDPSVIVRKLAAGSDHRPLLKEIKASSVYQIVLDCESDHIFDILEQAREVKLMEEYYSYILTSLDTHSIDLGRLKAAKSNITSLRLIDPNTTEIRMVAQDWELGQLSHNNQHITVPPESIRTNAALIYDALNLFITIFAELDVSQRIQVKPLNCQGSEISDHGLSMSAFIRIRPLTKGRMIGPLTGPLEFDNLGRRRVFALQIIERSPQHHRVVGVWSSKDAKSINYTISSKQIKQEIKTQVQMKTYRVKSRLQEPYLRIRKPVPGTILKGNNIFEGYVKDLLDGITEILNASYELSLVEDGYHGNYDPKKREWNGLIKEILERRADLAVCDLTITYERKKVVDFSMPFMTLGISILHSKARREPPALLSFMNPLSLDVWLYMATAYLGISIIIFLVARLAPGDWENPHPCNQEPKHLENVWGLKNCFWLTMGSIMNQGCDILPKGISTRMVTGMWWFFSLIITASYTANMAAFLTMERMGPTIESAEDLATQSKIRYGMMEKGATETFFKESNVSLYMRMWAQMQQDVPSPFERTNSDGVKRVRASKGLFAFLMESTSLEFERNRHCDLKEVGRWLDIKGYGIAMPVNSIYRTEVSGAVLKMQELGKLHELKEKWWKGKCEKESLETESAARLGLSNVGGVFVVLVGGMISALSVALLEFLWNVKKTAVQHHLTLREAFVMELKFAVNFKIREKVVHKSGGSGSESFS
ncbi:hypothetical protein PPYR_04432 [Photinus pyralis]|uniref:Glutamate receptor 1 n=4 Tax=Photinus pyralis TaxID=7054 RepID=A0A5N4AY50_PHOPY|nr:glutamate receptor ionotropic, kainate 2-like isoform X1 [Photinus pyralis]XP_031332970.1 glutamate receptor ionotropic, kainate 2-like isoform X1 [Photinus pyralis]XP_031332972.1 glutamate receptor ionotropic, kainate 2-like isoform X1 [Photinus pyralis]KAB0802246.1 hypothetical protein PPYR_04432 [Photinus pyralis]